MSTDVRAFLSIDIEDQSLLARIQKIQQKLDLTAAKIKIVNSDQIHFTLRFFGDTPIAKLNEIHTCLDKIEINPFEIAVAGVGSFPDKKRPRIIWIGVAQNASEIQSLKSSVDSALVEIGYKPEKQNFTPHATIARVRYIKDPPRLTANLETLADEVIGNMSVKGMKMIKSTLTPSGPIYEPLWEIR